MNEEHLALRAHLLADRLRHHVLPERHQVRLDRGTPRRRRLDDRQVAHARQRHLQRARDRRGGHREDVDADRELLQPLLGRDAEALFLVDDEQPEVLEGDVLREEPVRADDEVELSGRQGRAGPSRVSAAVRKRETISSFAGNGANRSLIVSKCCAASTVVGARMRDLLAVHDDLERRPHRHLGLPEADVADEQAGPSASACSRSSLTSRTARSWSSVSSNGNAASSSACHRPVGGERVAGRRAAPGVELEQLLRHRLDRLADPALDLLPASAAQLVEDRVMPRRRRCTSARGRDGRSARTAGRRPGTRGS